MNVTGLFFYNSTYTLQACRRWGAGGPQAPQFLADQLTLSQPGGQIMPTTVIQAPPHGFSDLATALIFII